MLPAETIFDVPRSTSDASKSDACNSEDNSASLSKSSAVFGSATSSAEEALAVDEETIKLCSSSTVVPFVNTSLGWRCTLNFEESSPHI